MDTIESNQLVWCSTCNYQNQGNKTTCNTSLPIPTPARPTFRAAMVLVFVHSGQRGTGHVDAHVQHGMQLGALYLDL